MGVGWGVFYDGYQVRTNTYVPVSGGTCDFVGIGFNIMKPEQSGLLSLNMLIISQLSMAAYDIQSTIILPSVLCGIFQKKRLFVA